MFFLTTGQHDRGIAQHDVLCAQRDRAQPRAANLIDGPSGGLYWQARIDMRLTCGVLALTGGQNLPQNGFRYFGFVDSRACDDRFQNGRAKVMCGGIGESAAERPDSRAGCGYDNYVGHRCSSVIDTALL